MHEGGIFLMFQVVKRDGELDEFKMGKITAAIDKAFDAKGKNYSPDMIDLLGLRVTADFQNKIENNRISVEDIQDSVENVLIQAGYSDVAKAYILYRKQREKIRNMKSTILDYKEIVNSYVKVEVWRVKENSTVTYSVGGLILSNSGAVTANYWLSEIYDNEIAEAHRNADNHIHDLSMLEEKIQEKGMTEAEAVKKGLIRRDTMWVLAKDTLLGKNYDVAAMRYVPAVPGEKITFKMDTATLKSGSGYEIKVFACEVPYKEYLRDMDAQLTYNLIDKAEKQGKFPGLRVGSLEEINNNAGNWE